MITDRPLDLTDLDDWNAANQRAMDAYHQDRAVHDGICVTCGRQHTPGCRECPPCRRARYKAAREAS